ncbi:alpha-amylase family glycosyl hydrolase, partial [Rhizobium leguminosarum]|uniref:alpha-amylase family glycosyl hydrolase n=1 Tax=Rhizobium leguminosarum TaxID=384 RepID=UPI003F9ADB37
TNAKADWYFWADAKPDGTPPNNWLSIFCGSAWAWDPTRMQYYLHNFLTSQPDMNLHNPEVQDRLLDVVLFWLNRGVDGFRLDTINFYFHDTQL